MRILLVSQHFWPESFRINELVHFLAHAGCTTDILTGQPNYPDGDVFPGHSAWGWGREDYAGSELFRVPLVPRGQGRALQLVANYVSFLLSACLFGSILLRGRTYKAVFVYATSPILQAIPALFIGWQKRIPVVIWVQDLWPESLEATGYVRNRFVLGAVRRIVKWIYRRADLLLVQSEAFIQPVSAIAGAVPVRYYPNSGEAEILQSGRVQLSPTIDTGFNVIFAGNLGTVQALDTIVEAATRLRDLTDVRFVIAGSGSRAAWLQSEIADRGLGNMILLGRLPAESMPSLFAQASVLLVTLSKSAILEQTVPSKVQSYLAAGKPIIAALNGETARIVAEAGAGIATPAEDPEALAEAVRALYSLSPSARDQMGFAARHVFEARYDPEHLAAKLKVILGEVQCRRR